MADAEKVVEDYIAEYIYKNTIILHDHIEVRNVDVPLPEIQVSKGKDIYEQIESCDTLEKLYDFDWMTKLNPKIFEAYGNKCVCCQNRRRRKR